jgi:hypothetical protein
VLKIKPALASLTPPQSPLSTTLVLNLVICNEIWHDVTHRTSQLHGTEMLWTVQFSLSPSHLPGFH